jgi:hypothetical protein
MLKVGAQVGCDATALEKFCRPERGAPVSYWYSFEDLLALLHGHAPAKVDAVALHRRRVEHGHRNWHQWTTLGSSPSRWRTSIPNFRWRMNAVKLAGGHSLTRLDPSGGEVARPSSLAVHRRGTEPGGRPCVGQLPRYRDSVRCSRFSCGRAGAGRPEDFPCAGRSGSQTVAVVRPKPDRIGSVANDPLRAFARTKSRSAATSCGLISPMC